MYSQITGIKAVVVKEVDALTHHSTNYMIYIINLYHSFHLLHNEFS